MASVNVAREELEKTSTEELLIDWDFSGSLASGVSVVSVDSLSSSPTGLTFQNTLVSGSIVQSLVSGGTSGTRYKTIAVVSTMDGQTLELHGYLTVRD